MGAKTITKGLYLMRGSVYYQTSQLAKAIFEVGAKKVDRVDSAHPHFNKIASYKTMEAYRAIWNNLANYLKEHFRLNDLEKIEEHHILAYIDYKIEYYPSRQYLQKMISAIGKLETALNLFSKQYKATPIVYDFSIRHFLLKEANNLELIASNYHNRAYTNPMQLIDNLPMPYKLAALIEYEGGARIEGCSFIKSDQMKGFRIDNITNIPKGIIFTKEKGGKEGEVLVNKDTYHQLEAHIVKHGSFKINRQAYMSEIRSVCNNLGINPEGSHGLRWNFAKRRMFEYAKAGYSHDNSLHGVSYEMKHNRASITVHYLG